MGAINGGQRRTRKVLLRAGQLHFLPPASVLFVLRQREKMIWVVFAQNSVATLAAKMYQRIFIYFIKK